MLCAKKRILNALLEKWRHFETLRTGLVTFLNEANSYCNPPFEHLGTMMSLMDIDNEMKKYKVCFLLLLLLCARAHAYMCVRVSVSVCCVGVCACTWACTCMLSM